jgi:cell division protease FtsH
MEKKPGRPSKSRPKSPPEDRKLPAGGGNSAWVLLAVGVFVLLAVVLWGGESQEEIPYGQLVRLIEQGNPEQHPKAAITVQQGDKDKGVSVRYSNLAKVKIGPYEITGTVTQQVVEPAERQGEPKPDVAFHTPRVGLENDNNALADLLHRNGFNDVRGEGKPGLWHYYMPMVILTGLAVLLFLVMVRKLGGTGSAMAFGRSRGKLYAQEDVGVTFEDVAGIDEAVDELREVVDFLKQPLKYQVLGGRIPKGVLLVGPPGTGKTLLAKATAGEAGVPFFSLSGSDFVEMFVGVGAARVRDMFQQAQAKAPCIVFIDELDALGKTRGSGIVGGHDEREQTLNALLVEMDGFSSNSGVIVMAATNRPETLDPALLRPGRFDRHVLVDRPDVRGREEILEVHVEKVRLDESVNLKEVARITSGFVGADLANLVNEAALLAARAAKTSVTMQEFNEGVERITAGLEKRQRVMHVDEKQRVAYHESAHALVAASLPNTDPVHKVSIIPRGLAALGYTMQRPEGDRYLMTQSELESRIQVLLGGTLAEEMTFGDVSTGAQNDLERATEIARSMVMDFGMTRLGRVTYRENRRSLLASAGELPGERTHSEQTAREIDEEIKRILAESEQKVRRILESRRAALVAIAERLIEQETIDNGELKSLIAAASPSPMLVPGTADAAAPRRAEEPPARGKPLDGEAAAGL